MKKKILAFLLSTCMILSICSNTIEASTLSEDKNKFTEVSSEIKAIDDEISSLNTEIDKLNEDVTNNESELEKVQNEISSTEIRMQELNDNISDNEELLSSRLREMYKHGGSFSSDIVDFIFSSTSISDLIDRLNSSKILIDTDNKLITETKDNLSEAEDAKKSIEENKTSLLAINSQIKSDLDSVNKKQDEVSNKKVSLNAELEKLSASIEQNENNLVSHQIAVINSDNPTMSDLELAIETLNSLLSQLSKQSVINKVNSAIKTAKDKLEALKTANKSSASSNENSIKSSSEPNSSSYKQSFSMEATAYTAHTLTAMGIKPVRIPSGISSVAVDPDVIPLGTKLYIPGYGYALACDTGSAIKGNKIDLFMNSTAECLAFGRRTITVNVLAYPGEW